MSQKIEDEFPKEVFSGLPSIKIQDHQFEFIFNRPKDLIDYSSWRTCVVHHAIYNIMAKIRGRIFLKKGGMMRFDKGTIHVLIWPFRRARAKRFKDNLNGLIQHIWVEENSCRPEEGMSHGPQGRISMIQPKEC